MVGQPISPTFGVQFAGGAPANVAVALPANVGGNNANNPSLLEACARGSMPRNANISTVGGVSAGAGDNLSIDEAMSCGNGPGGNGGAAIAGTAGNPATMNATSNAQQIFVDGTTTAAASLSTGPVPSDTSTLTQAPTSGNTFCGNIALTGSYEG